LRRGGEVACVLRDHRCLADPALVDGRGSVRLALALPRLLASTPEHGQGAA